MRPFGSRWPLLAALSLTIAGCGGGTTTTVIQTSGPTSSSTAPSETSTTPSGPPTRSVHLSAFQSPTGNMGCMIVGATARCDIAKRSWSPPPRPASCPNQVDFGQGLEIGASGPGALVCAGDTARDITAPKLAYGTSSDVGAFSCVSRSTGMTCTNRSNGHGFFISVESYRIF